MTFEDIQQELERVPFHPVRLHLSSGKVMDIIQPGTAWLRQNTLLVVHPLKAGTVLVENEYDVIALRLIERIQHINGNGDRKKRRR